MVDFCRLTALAAYRVVKWLGITTSKYYNWKQRYGKANEHNGRIPRDHWLEAWEKEAIVEFHARYPLEGYRRLAFMMLDADIVAASPATVYRVLRSAGVLRRWNPKPTSKGQGFRQPLAVHEHWHIDIAHINICGTFYHLASLLDGCSRSILHWEIGESMIEEEVELMIERARERYPGVAPRIISDNGPQFISRDFKSYIRLAGMTHVRTSPYYPQSNGKIERYHRTLKSEAIRPKTPLSLEDAKRVVELFVRHYNEVRLHSAIGYITPKCRLEGRHEEIWESRDEKLARARERRRLARQEKRTKGRLQGPRPREAIA